jgi:hypothetical protein
MCTGFCHGCRRGSAISQHFEVTELRRTGRLAGHRVLAGGLASGLTFGGGVLTEPLNELAAVLAGGTKGMRAIARAYPGYGDGAAVRASAGRVKGVGGYGRMH